MRFRDPSLWQFMLNNFVLSEANVTQGRIWTILTSAFSHSQGQHIILNCLGLYFIAPAAAGVLGSAGFLGLYLAGDSILPPWDVAPVLSICPDQADRWSGSEGASGAIYATLGFWGSMSPQSTIYVYFLLPLPVWVFIGGIFAFDLYGIIFTPNSGTDSAAHVGGLLTGLVMAYRLKRFPRW
ncbi:MAG: hypothetical protein TREMPRED_001901 [Tremellales sp. Tagirdzhanova-0007]|nr:MAG: hypothetical protein TREMPRED_001901 [Tremellales sp. Tagirdzhanova-0007]